MVASFDGSARVKRKGGAYIVSIRRLKELIIVAAAFGIFTYIAVNEAKCR